MKATLEHIASTPHTHTHTRITQPPLNHRKKTLFPYISLYAQALFNVSPYPPAFLSGFAAGGENKREQ